jgi:hypothetical protein
MKPTLSIEERKRLALVRFGELLDVLLAGDAPAAAAEYSQVDGQRPIGVGRVRYLRAWRRGYAAGDPEVREDGRARLMTPAAWARHGATVRRREAKPELPVVSSDLLAELGARRTG